MKNISKSFARRIFKNFGLKTIASDDMAVAFMTSVAQEVSEVLALVQDADKRESPKSIHAIRVTFKRLRAYWRLIRPALSNETFKQANDRIRNTAKLLAGHRDLQVMLESLVQIEVLMSEKELLPEIQVYSDQLKSDLSARIEAQVASLPPIDWPTIQKSLEEELSAWQSQAVAKGFMKTLQQGFELTLAACHQNALAGIAVGATSEDRHEWRKWVKHGYYQLKLLQTLGSAKGQKVVRKLDQLGNLLGKEHDFEILYLYLKSLKSGLSGKKSEKDAHKTLQKFTRQRLAHLKKQVNHLHSELLKSW